MAADSYSHALSMRRGRSLDSHLMHPDDDAPLNEHIENNVKHQAAGALTPPTPASHDAQKALGIVYDNPIPDEHPTHPMERAQQNAEHRPEIDDAVHTAVTGGADKDDYEAMKGHAPRSLGERAKMDALKKKHG